MAFAKRLIDFTQQQIEDVQRDIDRIDKDIAASKARLDELRDRRQAALAQLDDIRAELAALRERVPA